jgi:hypothetical protein
MPTIRKITAEEAEQWERTAAPQRTSPPDPALLRQLIKQLADKRGITRIDRRGAAGGEHAWRGRVYTRGIELHRQFADALYGGPEGALRAAVDWRDGIRKLAGLPQPKPRRTPRVVRAEYRRLCGWIAYAPTAKRYFADGAHGGRDAAQASAQAWLHAQIYQTAVP